MKLKLFAIIIISCFTPINQSNAQSNKSVISINEGTGYFYFYGGAGHEDDTIKVFYNKPKKFTKNSKILLVIPGAGRNADDYRDSWVEASEKHSVLVLSPSYPRKSYNYGGYHLGGIVKDLDESKGVSFRKGTNIVDLLEDQAVFNINPNADQWIYHDLDRLFDTAVKALKSKQKTYDIFGHSAGGQVLHRFAIFAPNSKANRILASNSGSYTLPNNSDNFPFGIANLDIKYSNLKRSFKKELVIFLGELDNENETGGLLLRSPTVDKQGTHRFARGNYFHKESKQVAKTIKCKFNWKLKVVPNVGHNQRKMAKAAAHYLYESDN